MTRIAARDCASGKETVLIAMPQGIVLQPAPFCLTWKCENRDCRMIKATQYLSQDFVKELEWYGKIPDGQWNAVLHTRKRNGAKTFVITTGLGYRVVASTKNLTRRTHTMQIVSERWMLTNLLNELINGSVIAVSPRPPKVSKGGKMFHKGDAVEQYMALAKSKLEIKAGEVGRNALYGTVNDQNILAIDEIVRLFYGNIDTVKLERRKFPNNSPKDTRVYI